MNWRRIFVAIPVRITMSAVLLGFIVAIAGCSMHTNEDSEQSEENGQADVKNADMYMEEAQAYIEAGNYLLAVQVLMEGAEELGDDSLEEKEKELREHIIVRWKKIYEKSRLCEEYEYDDLGNVVKYVRYRADGSYDLSEYGESGKKIKETRCLRDDSITGVEEYEYDEAGNQIKSTWSWSDGSIGNWCEYEYDDIGNMIKKIEYYDDGSVYRRWEYEYTEDRSQKKLVSEYRGNGDIQHRWEYEYDNIGNLIKYVSYENDGSVGSKYEYKYSESGRWEKSVTYDSDGNMTTWSESEYDEADCLIKSTYYYSDGSIHLQYEYEYKYDDMGNVIERTTWSDGEIIDHFVFQYNVLGDLYADNTPRKTRCIYEYAYID